MLLLKTSWDYPRVAASYAVKYPKGYGLRPEIAEKVDECNRCHELALSRESIGLMKSANPPKFNLLLKPSTLGTKPAPSLERMSCPAPSAEALIGSEGTAKVPDPLIYPKKSPF